MDGSRPAVRRALIGVAVLPIVTAALRAVLTDWFPVGDSALLYLRTKDVLTEHHPWLGSWSSASISLGEHINNPGPIYADLVAPVSKLLPIGPGNAIGVGLINVLCVIGAALAARRIGGAVFERWILLAAAAIAWTMGSELLFDIFQAHALLLPFLLAIVLFIGAIEGHAWAWPWLIGVASVILQTHVSYAYIVVILGLAGVVVLLTRLPTPRWATVRSGLASRASTVSLAVFAVLWSQSAIEQFFGDGTGNLTRLVRNASGGDVSVGLRNASKMVASIVALPPWWSRQAFADTIVGTRLTETPDGPRLLLDGLPSAAVTVASLLAVVCLLAACWWRAHRRRETELATVCVLALVGVVGGVVALGRLTVSDVGFAPHHTRWLHVIAVVVHIAMIWSATALIRERWSTSRIAVRAPSVAVIGAIGVLTIANLPYHVQRQGALADVDSMPAMEQLLDDLDRLEAHQPVLYRTDDLRVFEPYSSTFQSQLQARGIEFRVADEIPIRQLGEHRRADGSEAATIRQLEGWAALTHSGPDCLLARASRLDAADHRAMIERAERLVDQLTAAGLDLSAVAADAGASEDDRALAGAVTAGAREAIRHATYDGRLLWWADNGGLVADDATLQVLRTDGPLIRDWTPTVIALAVSPAEICDG